jgi:hypothetical protein
MPTKTEKSGAMPRGNSTTGMTFYAGDRFPEIILGLKPRAKRVSR